MHSSELLVHLGRRDLNRVLFYKGFFSMKFFLKLSCVTTSKVIFCILKNQFIKPYKSRIGDDAQYGADHI